MQYIQNYLEIEKIRFGDRLVIRTQIAPDTLSIAVPSLILQPVVENALKHGIGKKIGTGTLSVHSRIEDSALRITVEDDGNGFSATISGPEGLGIGLTNVEQRLKKTFGKDGGLSVTSGSSQGAKVELFFPCKKI